MQNFLMFLFLSFFGFSSLNEAMDIDFETPTAAEFDSEASWSDMHNYALGRAEWFRMTIKTLTNEAVDLQERVALAKKIMPALDESRVPVSKGLSLPAQKKFQCMKLLNCAISDIFYSSLYWDFLERTLEFYNTFPNNTPEIRNSVLPHLSNELINFDLYALDDIKEPTQCRYYSEEYFVNRAIFQECEALAGHYEITIDKMMQAIDAHTNEVIDLSAVDVSAIKSIKLTGKTEQASCKVHYFMEQLIYFRNNGTSSTFISNLNHPMRKAFQAYILPVSGSIFIKEAPQIVIETKRNLPKKAPNNKSSKQPARKKEKLNNNRKQSIQTNLDIPSHIIEAETNHPEDSKDENLETGLKLKKQNIVSSKKSVLETAEPQTLPTKVIIKKEVEPFQKITPINLIPIMPFVPRKLNIRDVLFQIQHRNSTDYSFQGKVYNFPFRAKSPECFDVHFLNNIKRITHLSPKTDKLPNLAQGAITFHYQIGDKEASKTIKLEELFLSGGKFFGKGDFDFKRQHKIVNALQDMLTREERDYIDSLSMGKKGIPLAIAMEKHLRRLVVEGPWKNNCVDSEAILILKLLQKLPNILRYELVGPSDQHIMLKHAVLSILSYRDCCSNCQKLIQGFQWRLHDLILGFNIPGLSVDDHFGTLAIVKGHIRGQYQQEISALTKGILNLEDARHTLVCSQSH